MYPKIILKSLYSFLFISSTGLLFSCASSLYIGSASSESEHDQISSQSSANEPYATRTNYLMFQEGSTQTMYDHRKGLSAKNQVYPLELKAETNQNPKVTKRINRLENKVNKRAKQHLKADLKEMRAHAKLDRAIRKAGIHTNPYLRHYDRHTYGQRCYHK